MITASLKSSSVTARMRPRRRSPVRVCDVTMSTQAELGRGSRVKVALAESTPEQPVARLCPHQPSGSSLEKLRV